MKTAFITGITGQIGHALAQFLLDKGVRVYGIVRNELTNQPLTDFCDEIIKIKQSFLGEIKIVTERFIPSYLDSIKPEYFINCAAQTSVADSWGMEKKTMEINLGSVIDHLDLIRKTSPKTRYLNIGSSEEFAPSPNPKNESSQLGGSNPYSWSKLTARAVIEKFRENDGIYAIQPWLFNCESSTRRKNFASRKIIDQAIKIHSSICSGESFDPIKLGNISSTRDWSYVDDVVEALWLCLHQTEIRAIYAPWSKGGDKIKDYIISSGESHSVKEFVERVFSELGIEGCWVGEKLNEYYLLPNYLADFSQFAQIKLVEIDEKFYREEKANCSIGDNSLIKEELRWELKYNFDSMIKKIVSDLNIDIDRNQ